MHAAMRNAFLLWLVMEQPLPLNNKFVNHFAACAAEASGLYTYRDTPRWPHVLEAWRETRDCPVLSEALRFPDGRRWDGTPSLYYDIAIHIIRPQINRCHRDDVDYQEQLELRYQLYDLLDDLLRPSVPLYRQRQKLARIRELIGEENYAAGRIPPPLP